MNRPRIMGILNVTPDSFSDGGQFEDIHTAIRHGIALHNAGADWVDVGGESTRPGAKPVSANDEMHRVLPVIVGLVKAGVKVSIDSQKAIVARAALGEGASFVNDVSAWRDPEMAETCLEGNACVCLMHMRGTPESMQTQTQYVDVVAEVEEYLIAAATRAERYGVLKNRIYIDPGFGFAKSLDQNVALLRHLETFVRTGFQVLVGVSRKSFLGRIVSNGGEPGDMQDRVGAVLAAELLASTKGVSVIRTHDVKMLAGALSLLEAL